jgi:hypothetical protein
MEAADSLGMRLLGLAPQVEHVASRDHVRYATAQIRGAAARAILPLSLASLSALRRWSSLSSIVTVASYPPNILRHQARSVASSRSAVLSVGTGWAGAISRFSRVW